MPATNAQKLTSSPAKDQHSERPTGSVPHMEPDRPPILHDTAPDFVTRTTQGERSLSGYRGRWLVFFSHPADFTPVCTSEFVAFARAFGEFQNANCDLLALSVDSLFAHLAWVRSIQSQFEVEIPFPIAEDAGMKIARAYGMVDQSAQSSATVRATFVIDPEGVIRAILWYPMTIGRNVAELLRLVHALQTSDQHDVLTPEGWTVGAAVIDPIPGTSAEAASAAELHGATEWYFRTKTL
jgi:peroxiredoxin (alkyl hydroperoxide reductase subunit C)